MWYERSSRAMSIPVYAPVYNAHVACEAIYDRPRRVANYDDHYLRSLARKGGLAAVYVWPGQL